MHFGGYFTYGDYNSETHNLVFAQNDTSEMLAPVSSKKYSTLRGRANEKRYIYDSSYDDTLTFDAEIFVCDGVLTDAESRTVCRTLFNSNEYKWLKLKDDAWDGIHLNCVMTIKEKIVGGVGSDEGVIGYKITISCDSPFAWEDADSITILTIPNDGLCHDYTVDNPSDYEKYTYPTMFVTQANISLEARLVDEEKEYERGTAIPAEDLIVEVLVGNAYRFRVLKGFTVAPISNDVVVNNGSIKSTASISCSFGETELSYTISDISVIPQYRYRVKYDVNPGNIGYNNAQDVRDMIVSSRGTNSEGARGWKDSEDSAYLYSNDKNYSIALYSAYGNNSYFYIYSEEQNQVRFGLGWSFTSGASSAVDCTMGASISLHDIPEGVIESAQATNNPEVFEITVYMVWSSNYYAFESKISEFQHTYMDFSQNEVQPQTLRGINYSSGSEIYIDNPSHAMLPATDAADASYKYGGVYARTICPDTNDFRHGKYAWTTVGIENIRTANLDDLCEDELNDFTEDSLRLVNARYKDIFEKVIYNPCADYRSGIILPQSISNTNTLTRCASRLNKACQYKSADFAQNNYMLDGLLLKDADLDYRLSDAEMAAFNVDENEDGVPDNGVDYGLSCLPAPYGGIGYTSDYIEILRDTFGDEVYETYPPCETTIDDEGTPRHHSFNDLLEASGSVLGKANAIFATFGFDPTQARDPSVDYFTSGNTDENGWTINPDCPYTTESVYRLFDLIYGADSGNGVYESQLMDSQNSGVALYYQVKDIVGDGAKTLLRKPSQEKLDKIVTMMVYEYHSLELKWADYTEFKTLFADYFWATWGTKLSEVGYGKSNYLTAYQGYFTADSYAALDQELRDYFSEPGVLLPNGDGERDANGNRYDFPWYKIVEQDMVNGKNPIDGSVRVYGNYCIDESEIDLNDFLYADCTMCAELCSYIDSLVPNGYYGFADTAGDCEVTLKNTVGGMLKAYVNGQYVSPQAGKITVPAGSHVEFKITPSVNNTFVSIEAYYESGEVVNFTDTHYINLEENMSVKVKFA